jgi:alpha-glutamyl/putrescinyl thymine pyrophosphorylase clade 1
VRAVPRGKSNVVRVSNTENDPAFAVADMLATALAIVDRFSATSQRESQQTLDFLDLPRPRLRTSPPLLLKRVRGLRTTDVYDTYWRFAAARQEAYFRRLAGEQPPWAADPILQRHRFTNVYRASDRVSQYLIRHVLYRGSQEPREVFFRALLFKFFNKIGTWELLEKSAGIPSATDFRPPHYDAILSAAMKRGERIYSAAYIMPTAPGGPGEPKHRGHLRILEAMLRDDLPERITEASSLRAAFELLRAYPMMGDFLAYQYAIDINYSVMLDCSESEFVVPGPGARSGLRKCFSDTAGLSDSDLIRMVTDSQNEEFERLGLTFSDLWGRPLQLIDCQNLFCEVDKYSRVAHPELAQRGGRTRIKQLFRPAGAPPVPWFPPKWGLNERILETEARRK